MLALQGGFEAASGHRFVVGNDTAGGLVKRIEGGEAFDMAIITPNAIDTRPLPPRSKAAG